MHSKEEAFVDKLSAADLPTSQVLWQDNKNRDTVHIGWLLLDTF